MDRNAIASLIASTGRGIILPTYQATPSVFERVALVQTIDNSTGYEGRADDVMEDVGEFTPHEQGQKIDMDRPGRVGVAAVKYRKFARGMKVPKETAAALAASPNPEAAMGSYLQRYIQQWGEQSRANRDVFLAGMLEKGVLSAGNVQFFDNSYAGFSDPNPGKIYDGVSFFNAAHPLRTGTRSNLNVTAPLTLANLAAARVQFSATNAVSHRGVRLDMYPDTLVVPPSLEDTAIQLVGSASLPGTAQNDVNPQVGRYTIVVNRYLSSSDGWYLMKRGYGLEMWSSGAPVVESAFSIEDDSFVLTLVQWTGGRVVDWRCAIANNYAAS